MRRKTMIAAVSALAMGLGAVGMTNPANAAQARTEVLAHLNELYAGSEPDSPARFRIIEETDRIGMGVISEHAQARLVEDAT